MKKLMCVVLVFVLAGFCACGQNGIEEPITTTAEAVPGAIEHAVTKRIHDSLPEFTFTLYGTPERIENELEIYRIHAIEISGDDFHQRLDGFETFWGFVLEDYGLKFDDFNCDSYLDIQLLESMGGSIGNNPSLFWLWDNEKQCFVRNEQLERLSAISGIWIIDQRLASAYNIKGDKWGIQLHITYMRTIILWRLKRYRIMAHMRMMNFICSKKYTGASMAK